MNIYMPTFGWHWALFYRWELDVLDLGYIWEALFLMRDVLLSFGAQKFVLCRAWVTWSLGMRDQTNTDGWDG
jgi:hypothetical protein